MPTDTTVGITVGEMKGLRADFEEKLASENGREWMDGFKLFLKRQNPWVKGVSTVTQKVRDLLGRIKEVLVGATDEKKVSELFIGARYYYRDPNINSWLPEVSKAVGEGKFSVYQLMREANFKEVALAILGLDGMGVDDVAERLIAGGHTTAPVQIQNLIERTDAGEDTGLLTSGYGNFFFVEKNDGSVCVMSASQRSGVQWGVHVYRFDREFRWLALFRFFARN